MVVLKFGGTSVAEVEAIRRVAGIVAAEGRPRVVVVSALAGVTDALLQLASAGGTVPGHPPPRALEALLRRHITAAETIRHRGDRAELEHRLYAIAGHVAATLESSPGRLSARARDDVAAAGELWSSRLLAAVFRDRGLRSVWVDAREVMRTDSRHGHAAPDLGTTRDNVVRLVRPHLDRGGVVVLGGFIGCDADGATTTLGRGGSDCSAAVLGACLDAEEIQIWSDVDGVLTADPRLVPHARVVPHLSYREAHDLASFGARVLHPGTIAPAVDCAIPVVVRNSHRPHAPGTVVSAPRLAAPPRVAGLACRVTDGLATVTIVGDALRAEPDLAAAAAGALRDLRVHTVAHRDDRRALSFVVDATHSTAAMSRLHDFFFGAGRRGAPAARPAVQA